MYSKNGNFGEVRLAHLPLTTKNSALFSFVNLGWHKCNDLYQIARPQGGESALLLFTVGGEGKMELANTHYTLHQGSVALIPKGIPCRYYTPKSEEWEFYWIHPNGTLSDGLLAQNFLTYYAPMHPAFPYARRMEELLSLCSKNVEKNRFLISAKLSEVMHYALADLCGTNTAFSSANRAKAYLEERFYENIKIEEIANALYITPTHLIRIFKKEFDCTPHQYLLQYRLETAAHLLKVSALDVREIAQSVGFASTSLFIAHFREKYGTTPMCYRKQ